MPNLKLNQRIFFHFITIFDNQWSVLIYINCLQSFGRCERYTDNQHIELVWWIFNLIMFSGKPHRIGMGHSLFLWPRRLCCIWWQFSLTNFQISFSAWGSCFLKLTPCMHLSMLMVYSLVITSLMAEQPFFLPPFFVGAILPDPGWKAGILKYCLYAPGTPNYHSSHDLVICTPYSYTQLSTWGLWLDI